MIFTTGIRLGYRAWLKRRHAAQDRSMPTDLLTYHGGEGEPLVLVHGLMGRAALGRVSCRG
ncbi:hypothetical protein I551_3833 [Mycobacterium ulcerans str. Harvey]|uniref:Alpha/beta hydrolase n=1 Tax=Mycobacterium ulcerans str. Harvey TaxID=1299332 RepID=A0ABP3AJF6_MYCUL|nr:hypothetical protein I551_3833 [Mycobacterium ulcerans str. Harvey]